MTEQESRRAAARSGPHAPPGGGRPGPGATTRGRDLPAMREAIDRFADPRAMRAPVLPRTASAAAGMGVECRVRVRDARSALRVLGPPRIRRVRGVIRERPNRARVGARSALRGHGQAAVSGREDRAQPQAGRGTIDRAEVNFAGVRRGRMTRGMLAGAGRGRSQARDRPGRFASRLAESARQCRNLRAIRCAPRSWGAGAYPQKRRLAMPWRGLR